MSQHTCSGFHDGGSAHHFQLRTCAEDALRLSQPYLQYFIAQTLCPSATLACKSPVGSSGFGMILNIREEIHLLAASAFWGTSPMASECEAAAEDLDATDQSICVHDCVVLRYFPSVSRVHPERQPYLAFRSRIASGQEKLLLAETNLTADSGVGFAPAERLRAMTCHKSDAKGRFIL